MRKLVRTYTLKSKLRCNSLVLLALRFVLMSALEELRDIVNTMTKPFQNDPTTVNSTISLPAVAQVFNEYITFAQFLATTISEIGLPVSCSMLSLP